ncbi:30S ribosomal protein S25 [Thermogladius sp. 4427co]|uniref:30S ribosomal protein S25 n=1 Tax=Thermogladius sp. 4427co TaxID=3450718 RepID=UPI003F79B74B
MIITSRRKEEKAPSTQYEHLVLTSPDLNEDLIRKFERELKKMAQPYVTPYIVSQQLGVKVSTAKKLLRIAEEKGLIKIVSHTRRVRVYVPSKQG